MTIKSKFQNLIAWVIGALFICAAVFLLVMFVKGMHWVADVILPFLNDALAIMYGVCLLILLPLALIKRARIVSVIGLGITFQVSLMYLWLVSMVVAYGYWGAIGVIIGLLMSGVGVIPVAFVAAIFNGAWSVTGELAYLLGSSLLTLALTAWIASKLDE